MTDPRRLRAVGAGELDPFVVEIFLHEVDRQVRFAIIATGDLHENVHGPRPDEERLWYSIQNFLVAAGNISKLLWPQGDRYASRGARLRELLRVPDDSPLGPRTFRNHFEHFDERLERWAEQLAHGEHAGMYFDSNIGSLTEGGRVVGVELPHQVMRHFDPSEWTVSFRGERYQLRPAQRAAVELSGRVRDALDELRPRRSGRT